MKQKHIMPLTFAFMIVFSFGYYLGVKFTDDRLTRTEIADNIESYSLRENILYPGIMYERKIGTLLDMYHNYNLGELKPARQVLEHIGYRICNKRTADDIEYVPVNENNVSLVRFMNCLLEDSNE